MLIIWQLPTYLLSYYIQVLLMLFTNCLKVWICLFASKTKRLSLALSFAGRPLRLSDHLCPHGLQIQRSGAFVNHSKRQSVWMHLYLPESQLYLSGWTAHTPTEMQSDMSGRETERRRREREREISILQSCLISATAKGSSRTLYCTHTHTLSFLIARPVCLTPPQTHHTDTPT